MNKLSKDFTLIRYGLKVRLVNQDDAEFILSLRADPERTKYMITLDDEISYQKEWIKEYKKREKKGLDYYFIYSDMNDKTIGVNRLSMIDNENKTAKNSSWIVIEGLKYESIKMYVIRHEIAFNLLDIQKLWGEVHKMNSKAIRINKLFGYMFKDLNSDFFYIYNEKSIFHKSYKDETVLKFLNSKTD